MLAGKPFEMVMCVCVVARSHCKAANRLHFSQILSLTAMKSTTPCFVKMMHELKYCKESVVCHVRCDNGDLSYMRI